MVKKKELSEDLCQRLVSAHSEGKGYKAISKQYDVPVATVQSIINKHKRFNTVKNLSGRGRKRKVSPRPFSKEEWANMTQETCRKLVDTYKNHLEAVIKTKAMLLTIKERHWTRV